MRNAGVKYADAVNRLIQNYLTKTTTTNKTGGSRTEIIDHPQVVSTRQVLDTSKSGNGSGSGSSKDRIVNVDITQQDGSIKRNSYTVDSDEKYKSLQGILKRHYNNILTGADEKAQNLYQRLMDSHVIKGVDAQGQYIFDDEMLLKNGQFWYLDDPTRRRIEKDVPGIKFKYKDPKQWKGVEPEKQTEYDDD